jgi:membrane AbrB-like protein
MTVLAPGPSARPPALGWNALGGLVILFALTTGAGWVFERIGSPLPWMIGPLVLTAAIFMGPVPHLQGPNGMRGIGQVVVATQIGLAFSPAAFRELIDLAPVILGTTLAMGVCVFIVAVLVSRLTGMGLTQAFLSAAPTSPVEAAAMAQGTGSDPVPVIISQTIRLALVAIILPFGLFAVDGWPEVARQPVLMDIGNPESVVRLAIIGVASAWVCRALRVQNPKCMGPLTVAASLAVSGIGPVPYPPAILALAQVILGTWLGANFNREIIGQAVGKPRLFVTFSAEPVQHQRHLDRRDFWRGLANTRAGGGTRWCGRNGR